MSAPDLERRRDGFQVVERRRKAGVELSVIGKQSAAPCSGSECPASARALGLALEDGERLLRGVEPPRSYVRLDQVGLPLDDVGLRQPGPLGEVSGELERLDRGVRSPEAELEQAEGR